MRILVFGGAGFIGSHTVDALVDKGHEVRVFDGLDPQVHINGELPSYLNPAVEFIRGDVRDPEAVRQALHGIDAVFFLAAAVGVGQSMYEIRRYVEINSLGVANLLDILAQNKGSVQKLIVASSMSIYGEGAYECPAHGRRYPSLRPEDQLLKRFWEMQCDLCGKPLESVPTAEDKPLIPTSVYAITKRDHEEMCLVVGRAYDIPSVALRYFNVYGSRQALSNPYTGAVAIFASRIANGNPPLIYEDGLQSRDFIHVSDIVQANLLALERDEANYQIFNVGTGQQTTILAMAELIGEIMEFDDKPEIVERYRAGDIRHCFADIGRIQKQLGYKPKVTLRDGLSGMLDWLRAQPAIDRVEEAQEELVKYGLVR